MIIPHAIQIRFDDDNLIGVAGLVPAMILAQKAGLHDLLEQGLGVGSANAGAKASSVIAGMLAGADCIDDMDVLRHGATNKVFAGVRAPSTLGTFLRSFNHGYVQQIDAISRKFLAGLAANTPGLLAGATEDEGIAFIDVDDTIRATYGYQKEATSYGYSGVKGSNIQVGIVSTPLAAPVVVGTSLRKGSAVSGRGSGRFLTQAITTARNAGVQSRILCRADSAYYGWDFIGAALKAGTWFSVTVRMTSKVTAAIASIGEQAWVPIQYPHAIMENNEDGTENLVSDAEVAEVPFTAFTHRRRSEHVSCRLVVRRVKRLQPLESDGSTQGELFSTWRYHGFITNSALTTLNADARHRDHAIIEQTISELKNGPLAHLPSGKYGANAAWVALAAIAFNIARTMGVAAGMAHARWASLRRKLINVAARIARTGRKTIMHLPAHWPWQAAWENLYTAATGARQRILLTT